MQCAQTRAYVANARPARIDVLPDLSRPEFSGRESEWLRNFCNDAILRDYCFYSWLIEAIAEFHLVFYVCQLFSECPWCIQRKNSCLSTNATHKRERTWALLSYGVNKTRSSSVCIAPPSP